MNYNLFKEYFEFESPIDLAKQLFETKNRNKNNKLVNVIESGLIDLKDEIKKRDMSKREKKSKNQMK